MKQFNLKNLLLILSIFITVATTNIAFAKNICRGESVTLNYTSANVNSCNTPYVPEPTAFSGWNPQPGQTSSVTWNNVQTAGNFSLTCQNSLGTAATSFENIGLIQDSQCATISAMGNAGGSSCIIPENASSCTNALSWNTNGASYSQAVNITTGVTISTAPSASGMTYTTPYGGVQIQIRNNGAVLNSVTLGASCIAGTVS